MCVFAKIHPNLLTHHMVSLNHRVTNIYMLWISASNKEPHWRTRGHEPKSSADICWKHHNITVTIMTQNSHKACITQGITSSINVPFVISINVPNVLFVILASRGKTVLIKGLRYSTGKVVSSFSVKVCTLFYMPITIDLGMRQEMMAPSSKKDCLLTVRPTNNFVSPLFGITCLQSIKHL